MNYSIVFLLFAQLLISAQGLKCFSCTLVIPEGQQDVNMDCVNAPANVTGKNIITCPARMKFCTIVRNDLKNSGEIRDIERNCAVTPVIMNEDIESDDLISHYRSCTTDLCNKGKGDEDPSYGDGEDGGGKGGMVVKGKSSASSLLSASNPLQFLLLTTILSYVAHVLSA